MYITYITKMVHSARSCTCRADVRTSITGTACRLQQRANCASSQRRRDGSRRRLFCTYRSGSAALAWWQPRARQGLMSGFTGFDCNLYKSSVETLACPQPMCKAQGYRP